jgi:hypothetical protein
LLQLTYLQRSSVCVVDLLLRYVDPHRRPHLADFSQCLDRREVAPVRLVYSALVLVALGDSERAHVLGVDGLKIL